MADNTQIINLYTELAQNPNQDFGWDKGLENAKSHAYKKEWLEGIPSSVWDYCAAVGNPFKYADIKEDDVVVDLGCGAGVDVLCASKIVGDNGKVFGVDITPKMVETAQKNAQLIGANNVTILESSFDNIALEDESVDVVISNGAINLTSSKKSVFKEIHRILKPNGKIFFADMIDISEPSCCSIEQSSCCSSNSKEDWVNCVAGTMRESELIELIQKSGFKNVVCYEHTHYTTAKTTKGALFGATKIASEILREKHWESIFKKVDYTQVLWHQEEQTYSLNLMQKYISPKESIIDVGSGTSFLVDILLENNYTDITLLDTAQKSLEIVQKRLDKKAQNITFIKSDILNFISSQKYNLWHDRAVFHFLQTQQERSKYFEVLQKSLEDNGVAIIHTFQTDGATECAGLPVIAYNKNLISKELPKGLMIVESESYIHQTPKNTLQKYIYFVIRGTLKSI